jgi:amino acid transporter
VIALCFAQCAALLPRVGGPYAYAKEAWGNFAGFIVGWSLWLAEWVSLAVFPVAFNRYLMFFIPDLPWIYQILVMASFVGFLAVTNIIGVKAAGKTNDVLTLVKLAPLIFFCVTGLFFAVLNPTTVSANFSPFSPYGFNNFGTALVLIFWAYAGFEISTIPADEIKNPRVTIPRAIVLGISIVIMFYLITNTVLFAVMPYTILINDPASRLAPLASATKSMLNVSPDLALIGVAIVGVGALISVAGSDESGMIGTSRLGYALAVDGLFPRAFAKVHPKFKTPYLAIIIQAITALIAAILGNLSSLIATSVLFMSIAYVATSASIFWLRKKGLKPRFHLRGGSVIPILGMVFSLYLISQCTPNEIAIGAALILIGVPIYIKYTPKKELEEFREALLSRNSILKRAQVQEERFLAHLILHIKRGYRKFTGKKYS